MTGGPSLCPVIGTPMIGVLCTWRRAIVESPAMVGRNDGTAKKAVTTIAIVAAKTSLSAGRDFERRERMTRFASDMRNRTLLLRHQGQRV
jgi:hypothetical protein